MYGVFERYITMTLPERAKWFNRLTEASTDSVSAEVREEMRQFAADIREIVATPHHLLSPVLQPHHGLALMMLAGFNDKGPSRHEENKRAYYADIADSLNHISAVQALQRESDGLFKSSNENTLFSVPDFLDSLSKHLGRPTQFIGVSMYTESDETMTAQLMDPHACKPRVHRQLVRILLQAATATQPRHSKPCTCLLCSHLASVASSRATSS